MSLRLRLALAIAFVAAVVAAGLGVVVYDLAKSDRLDRARTAAASEARNAVAAYENTNVKNPGTSFEQSGAPRSRTIPVALRSRVHEGRVATILTTLNGHPVVVAGAPIPSGGWVYVRRSFEEDARQLADLRVTLFQVGIGAALAGALLGLLVSTLMARPLKRSAALARRIAGGDLTARLRPRGHDEIADLGRALDEMATALGGKITELDEAAVREQRFSADVAHELRTPITGLVAAAALLDDSAPARMVRDRASALAHLTEDLLEVMRLEGGDETAHADHFDLVRLVREVAQDRAVDAVIEAPEMLEVTTDARRVERILANLLDNAVNHGRPPIVVTVSHEATVTVRDRGEGFGAFLNRAGDRFAMGAASRGGGSGLGLAIVQGQARVIGASLELADAEGAVATLKLPAGARA